MKNTNIDPMEMIEYSILCLSDKSEVLAFLRKLPQEDSTIYCNFYVRFFSEFMHGGYIQQIEYFKDEEYDKVAKLTGFSYKQLVELLILLQKKDNDYINKLFEFCIKIEEKQGFQDHGLLVSLDTKPEITEALEKKEYKKLLTIIINDMNLSEDIEKSFEKIKFQ